jgi:IMP dehydrogenase
MIFTNPISFKDRRNDPVQKWMTPVADLKQVNIHTPFSEIHDRLLSEQQCSVLPVLDEGKLQGLYFMKDLFYANPAMHNGKPLVGMAVGVGKADLDRVAQALEMGVGIIVIDSSHGNCQAVIEQSGQIVKMASGRAAVIAGNVASIDGYYRLAQAGVDAVKCGIGSGSICTTSRVTGAGVPMFTLIRELNFIRQKMISKRMHAPVIIPDGGIDGPGAMVVALAAGGHACMSGKWLVAANESHSHQSKLEAPKGRVYYRGMASDGAIKSRSADRYGKSKTAPEGVEGYVCLRGLLRKFLPKDIELVRGGFAHVGARNLEELHEFSQWPFAFTGFTAVGQEQQINTSVTF